MRKEYKMDAAYIKAYRSGRLKEALRRASRWMKRCTLCPRMCRVDRTAGETGFCRTGKLAVVASYGPHYGEERPLVGRRGSGTIFFSHCNLFCDFCQNFDISHGGEGKPVGPEDLAEIMLTLQKNGCHNINFVTPSHVIQPILEALSIAVEKGLHVPLVYNCGGYERVSALKLLDGIVDIYMPDFKFWDPGAARELCNAPDYPERAREALREMHRQVGDLVLDGSGLAQRGVLVRHLVMPNGLAGTAEIVDFIATRISAQTYINIMDQYHPCGRALSNRVINRRITSTEFRQALDAASKAGLTRLDDRHRHWITVEL
ncbi:MAG: radical SAM protein [Syntrophobacteraceae bacterium]|jgi:putative pyruvate formate lyase activating enzyme